MSKKIHHISNENLNKIFSGNCPVFRKYRGEIDRFVSDLIARDEEQNDHMKDVRLRVSCWFNS